MGIKTDLSVSGVSTYKRGMEQAQGAVKALDAELQLCEAQYKATGDKATYLTTRTRLLKDKVDAQKKAVEQAERALDAMKQTYGENSTQVETWRTKLAKAKTSLINTQTQLTRTQTAMHNLDDETLDDAKTEVEDLGTAADTTKDKSEGIGTALSGIAGKLNIETITNGLDTVTRSMEKVMQKAAQMGQAIWNASTDAAEWADATRDAATQAHMSTTEYQRLAYAAQFFGTSVEQLTSKQGKIVKAMDSGDVIEVGSEIVDTMHWVMDESGNYVRKSRSWSDVMFDTIEALGQITDETERDARAQEIFGKSYGELSGIIEAGRDAWNERYNEAPVVSEESINSLADAADAIKDMDARLQTLKMEVLTALAPSIETIATAISSLATSLTTFIQSKEGQELMARLGESIESVVSAFTNVDFDKALETVKSALEDVIGAFEWLSKNKDSVVTAVQLIAGAFLALKGVSLGLKGANFVNSIRDLVHHGKVGGGGGTGGAGAASAAAGAGDKLSSFLSSGGALSNALLTVGLPTAVLAAGIAPAALAQQWDITNRNSQITSQVEAAEEAATALGESANSWMEIVNLAADAVGVDMNDTDWLGQVKLGDPARVMAGLKSLAPYASMLSDFMSGADLKELDTLWYHPEDSTLTDADINGLMERVLTGATGHMEEMRNAGEDASEGFAEGIEDGSGDAVSISEDMAWDVIFAVEDALDSHSPSRVMAAIGESVGAGFAAGIDDSAKMAIASASSMAGAVASIVASAMASLNSAIAATAAYAGSGGIGGGIYDGSTTVNIGTYNQNSGGDQYALADAVASAQKRGRQGYGMRK